MKFPLQIFFIALSLGVLICETNAQTYSCKISGRVLEDATGKPIENVNVYVSGTIWGTTTDEYGNFSIPNLPSGNHEVVASIIGYESKTISVYLKDSTSIKLTFKLKEAHYELQSITISGKAPAKWKYDLEIFKKRFFGQSSFASDCVIKNPEVINLKWINPHHLTAQADEPIIIFNNALGYKINCILVSFDWDSESLRVQATVRPSFTELTDTTGALKSKWQQNREIAYKGSLDNFLQSVKDNSLTQNGFQVFLDTGPESLIPERRLRHLWEPLANKTGNEYTISFAGFLRVLYILKDPANPETSWIKLLYPFVTLDQYGYPIEALPFYVYGYWAKSGIADMLPKYYKP